MLTALMGGELSVKSQEGQGTVFQLRLFLSEVRVPQAVVHVEHDIVGYHGPRRRVLVVDDHIEHRKVLAGMLEPLDFEVLMASNGQEALSQASLHNPDLILMDLSMPQLDGWQTARLMRRSLGSSAPILIISANAFVDGGSVSADCNDYLPKPVHAPVLLDKISQQLSLNWIRRAPAPIQPPAISLTVPALQALQQQASLGYVRGVMELLDRLQHEAPAAAAQIETLRGLAARFQLNELSRQLDEAIHSQKTRTTMENGHAAS